LDKYVSKLDWENMSSVLSSLSDIERTEAAFARKNTTAAQDISQALDNLLGPTRDPEELKHPLCNKACLMPNYRHVRTTQEDMKNLKVSVLLDSHCPPAIDMDLESFCNHPTAFVDNEKCTGGLPFEYFHDSVHQREAKGYYKSAYIAVFRRSIPYMRQLGWKNMYAVSWDGGTYNRTAGRGQPHLWTEIDVADVIITSVLHFREIVKSYPDKRYILVMTNDAATLSLDLGCDIEDGRIIAVLHHTALQPLAENNGALRGDRRHFMWFPKNATRDKLVPTTYRIPELDREGADKIRVLVPQVYRWRWPLDCGGKAEFTKLQPSFHHSFNEYMQSYHERWGRMRPSESQIEKELFLPFDLRQYDISYVGIINHGSTRELYGVNEHRQMAVDAIHRLQHKYPTLRVYTLSSTKLSYHQFLEIVKDSKVFVSPFGLGEFSGKDYEALLSGALLVKPAAEKLKAFPNIYLGNISINVKIDFSDLEEAVMPFLLSPAKARRRIHGAHEELRYYARMDTFATAFDSFLMDFLQRPVTYDPRGCYRSPKWFFDERGIRKPSLIIKHLAAERIRDGKPLYDPEPVVDAQEIMNQLEEEEELRRSGISTTHAVSKVPKVDVASRHTAILESYNHIVHSAARAKNSTN